MKRKSRPLTTRVAEIVVSAADIAALGAVAAGDLLLTRLPARAFVRRATLTVNTPGAGPSITALTGAVGTNSAAFDNLIVTGSLMAAADTRYGDADAEMGAALSGKNGFYVGAGADVMLHLAATGANLSAINAGVFKVVLEFSAE